MSLEPRYVPAAVARRVVGADDRVAGRADLREVGIGDGRDRAASVASCITCR